LNTAAPISGAQSAQKVWAIKELKLTSQRAIAKESVLLIRPNSQTGSVPENLVFQVSDHDGALLKISDKSELQTRWNWLGSDQIEQVKLSNSEPTGLGIQVGTLEQKTMVTKEYLQPWTPLSVTPVSSGYVTAEFEMPVPPSGVDAASPQATAAPMHVTLDIKIKAAEF